MLASMLCLIFGIVSLSALLSSFLYKCKAWLEKDKTRRQKHLNDSRMLLNASIAMIVAILAVNIIFN